MIEVRQDELTFSFPAVHPDARLAVDFQRTLRIPGGERELPRLPSLGRYPVYTVDSHAHRVPKHWLEAGGAMLPMYQSEAMWLSFRPSFSIAHQAFYPFAVKIRIGGLDVVGGSRWSEGLHQWPQDFLVVREHSWLGGYHDGRNGVRQFVAMPLGSGYVPEPVHGLEAGYGRLEMVVYPMQGGAFAMRYPRNSWNERLPETTSVDISTRLAGEREHSSDPDALQRHQIEEGLFPIEDWRDSGPGRFTLHLANSLHWCAITGSPPPMAPARVGSHHSPSRQQTLHEQVARGTMASAANLRFD